MPPYNNEQVDHAALLQRAARDAVAVALRPTSSEFGNAVMENWQSEYLQFSIFILATVWLVQKGSTESKELDQVGPESDRGPGDRRVRAPELAGVGEGRRRSALALLATRSCW